MYGNNDYRDYLQHARSHKYILKIGKGIGARYFYTQEEIRAFREKAGKKVRDAAANVGDTVNTVKKEYKKARRQKLINDFAKDPGGTIDREYTKYKIKKKIKDPINTVKKEYKKAKFKKKVNDTIDKIDRWDEKKKAQKNAQRQQWAREIQAEERAKKNKKSNTQNKSVKNESIKTKAKKAVRKYKNWQYDNDSVFRDRSVKEQNYQMKRYDKKFRRPTKAQTRNDMLVPKKGKVNLTPGSNWATSTSRRQYRVNNRIAKTERDADKLNALANQQSNRKADQKYQKKNQKRITKESKRKARRKKVKSVINSVLRRG